MREGENPQHEPHGMREPGPRGSGTMDDLRFARLMGRNAVEDVELRRLFDHKERLLALLRASRSPKEVAP